MKKLALASGVVAVLASIAVSACATEEQTPPAAALTPASADERKTAIHMTRNPEPDANFPAICLGSVPTERLGAMTGYTVSWKIKDGGGEEDSDKCGKDYNPANVQLHFKEAVMATMDEPKKPTMILKSDGTKIEGKVLTDAKGPHKYWVFYVDATGAEAKAGPDPEIIVNCSNCPPPAVR